ncbi:TnsA endonuclease N-terminal domain-containing protein [Kitasatospora sp. NPDC051702]|uniref:TnsA endonuclease N-terminal domain-containing protein n=2 Tax=Kitasatospora TaxID=2063 RepID=UPI003425A3A9
MQERSTGPRSGQPWDGAEDARLLEGARQGLGLDGLAARHGRTVGAIRARLARHVPLAGATDEELLRWVRSSSPGPDAAGAGRGGEPGGTDRDREPGGTDWNRGPGGTDRDPGPGHDAPAAPDRPDPAAAEVLAQWQQLTGHALAPERRAVFLARPALATLAVVDEAVRLDAGRRLWRETGQLLLEDWSLECRCPGAATLDPPWSAVAGHDEDTALILRELLAAAVDEIPGERDRRILARRFGVGDHEAQSLGQIGAAHGLSRERVRQLQNRAVRAMARSTAPAIARLRALLAGLGRLDGPLPEDDGPSGAERMLDLAQVLVPSLAPRQAVALLAALAGVRRAPADDLAARAVAVRALRHDAQRREATLQKRVERAFARWERLAEFVRWFGAPGSAPPRSELTALRQAHDEDPRSGSWHCPKLGRDVAYESDPELQLIQLLSHAPQIAYYQEQPLAIGYDFDGRARTYFPDLLVATADGRCVLVEVKALFEMATAVNIAKYRALEGLCRERGWGLLVTDGHRSRALIEEHRPDPVLVDRIGPLLTEGAVLGWPHVVAAVGGQRPPWLDFTALVLSQGWDWRTRPFRLSAGAAATATTGTPATAGRGSGTDSIVDAPATRPTRPLPN